MDRSPASVANATMDMLTKGTKKAARKEIAQTLEDAIQLNGSTDMDTARVSGSALLSKLDLAAEILRDVVENPTFPNDEFDIMQKQTRMGLLVSTKTPEYLAERELRRQLYGDHPYSRTTTGELEDLNKITIEAMKAWWSQHIRPENAVFYLAGDITPSDGFKLAEKYLASWKVEGKFTPPTIAAIPQRSATHIYLYDRPGSVQSQIRVGHIGIKRTDPMYFTARVMANIFGGGFNSRLNKAIRVDKGLTYGARGGVDAKRFAGEFRVSTFTKTSTTADTVKEILSEIDKMRNTLPTAQEVDDTKTYITGSFPGDRETPEATVGDLWMIETQGLPTDYLQKYLAGVKATSAEEVKKTAEQLIDPKKLSIVVIGEAAKVKESLEKIAPVTILNPPTQMPEEKGEKPSESQN
jgi:zinc protease